MAWLQSSFTNHQFLGDNAGSNLRKGYKVGAHNKNADPDKSETPLLHDSSQSPESENISDWPESSNTAGKKTTASNSSKQNLLSSTIFDRSGSNSKLKVPNTSQNVTEISGFEKKCTENKKLLSDEEKKNSLFDDDDDDCYVDSEDEAFPNPGGYKRIRP